MIEAEYIGAIAGVLTTICFIPQLVRAIKMPDTKAISLSMYLLFTMGVVLWLFYGLMLNRPAIIFSNSITFIFTLIILSKKIFNLIKKIDND